MIFPKNGHPDYLVQNFKIVASGGPYFRPGTSQSARDAGFAILQT